MLAVMKTTPNTETAHELMDTATAGSGRMSFTWHRKTDGNVDFRIKHQDGGARDIDWVAYKVTPA